MRGDCDLYRQQHRVLLDAVTALRARLEASLATAGDHEQVRRDLTVLAGKLTVHLQMEDRSLYPELLKDGSPELRSTVLRFSEQLGSLRDAAGVFFHRWLGPDAIESAPEAFAVELRKVLDALANRIAEEDAELFRLADDHGRPGS